MKRIGLLIGFLAVLVFLLPALTAQDKKDADKVDKKADAKTDEKKDDKKDPEKKDEKKDPEKKDEEKKKPEPKEKLIFGRKIATKIMNISGASDRDITVEMKEVDPKKVYDLQVWQQQQLAQLNKEQYNIATQKDFKQRITQTQNYQRSMYNYQMELGKRQGNIYMTKPWEVRAAENVKVRSLFPPVEFDDQGFQKKWTKKEIEERKDKTGLPGFAVGLDSLKAGQMVELYMAKVAAPAKGPMKKKNPDDDPPPMADRPEFVMIVITYDVGMGR